MKEQKKNTENSREIIIGGITYTVISHFDERSKDTISTKIERLILRDLKTAVNY